MPDADASSDATPEPVYGWTPAWAPGVLRWRWTLVVAWVGVQAICFNGQWRPGLDSALYRSIARGDAHADGPSYPGLPWALAGLNRLSGGEVVAPAIVGMLLVSAATLAATYLLIRRALPAWAATVVTAGVAFNHAFVQHGHEIMTDLPFLLGVALTLWGVEAARDGPRGRGVVVLGIGLVLAAVMRPTVWVLIGALAAWLVAPTRRPAGRDRRLARRAGAAAALLVLGAGVIAVVAVSGTDSHEGRLLARLAGGGALGGVPGELWRVLEHDLPDLFFAEKISYLSAAFTLALFGGVALLAVRGDDPTRRRPLWALLVACLLLAVLATETESRYWLMVLPLLWAGWLLGLMRGGHDWFGSNAARSIYVGLGVGAVLAFNLGHLVKLAIEQRSTPFLETYKGGAYAPLPATAEAIRRHARADDLIVGPYPRLLSYLADRRVVGGPELGLADLPPRERPLAFHRAGVDWMVFPKEPYERKDPWLFALMDAGHLYAGNDEPGEGFAVGVFGEGQERVDWWVAVPKVDPRILPPPDGWLGMPGTEQFEEEFGR